MTYRPKLLIGQLKNIKCHTYHAIMTSICSTSRILRKIVFYSIDCRCLNVPSKNRNWILKETFDRVVNLDRLLTTIHCLEIASDDRLRVFFIHKICLFKWIAEARIVYSKRGTISGLFFVFIFGHLKKQQYNWTVDDKAYYKSSPRVFLDNLKNGFIKNCNGYCLGIFCSNLGNFSL